MKSEPLPNAARDVMLVLAETISESIPPDTDYALLIEDHELGNFYVSSLKTDKLKALMKRFTKSFKEVETVTETMQ